MSKIFLIFAENLKVMEKKIHKLSLRERFELWMAIHGLTYTDFLWLIFGLGVLIWCII